MKKTLFATTAIAGLAALALPATAEVVTSKEHVTVTLFGNIDQTFNRTWQDVPVATQADREFDYFQDEAEIGLKTKSTSDFGMEYGLEVQLSVSSDDADATDEAFIWAEGVFGRIELGSEVSAPARMIPTPAYGQVGHGGVESSGFALVNTGGDVLITTGPQNATLFNPYAAGTTKASNKVNYFTPEFSGFRLGFAYVPDVGSAGDIVMNDSNGNAEHLFSLGAEFKHTFENKLGLHIAGNYNFGDNETSATIEDIRAWALGAKLDYAGFTLAGSYTDNNDSSLAKADTANGADAGRFWGVGLSYVTGPWGASLGYAHATRKVETTDVLGTDNDLDTNIYSAAVQYTVAPGLVVKSDLSYIDSEFASSDNLNAAKTDNDAIVWLVGTSVRF